MKRKKIIPGRSAKRKSLAPRTAADLFGRPEPFQDIWNRALRAIAKMRADGISLKKASKEAGVTARMVKRLSGRALKKGANGRYSVAKRDTLLRVLQVPNSDGSREIALRNSKHASTLGKYWDAVHKYLRTGDSAEIEKFAGKRIKLADGSELALITDLRELNRLGSAGVLSFESLYARSA